MNTTFEDRRTIDRYPSFRTAVAPLASAEPGMAMDSHRRKNMSKARILIVEVDPSPAEVLDYNLSQEGYETQVAADGQQGLREIRLRAPDLVILDLMLPMIEGLEVCRLLRADAAT